MSENKSFDPFDDPEFCAGYEEWLKSIEPSSEEMDMMIEELAKEGYFDEDPEDHSKLQTLYNACHDFGEVVSGEFPSFDAVVLAKKEGRLESEDCFESGFLAITGKDECHIFFEID